MIAQRFDGNTDLAGRLLDVQEERGLETIEDAYKLLKASGEIISAVDPAQDTVTRHVESASGDGVGRSEMEVRNDPRAQQQQRQTQLLNAARHEHTSQQARKGSAMQTLLKDRLFKQ